MLKSSNLCPKVWCYFSAFGGVNDIRYRRQSGNEENGDSSKSSENQPEKSTESTISQPVNSPSPQAEIFGLHLNAVTHKVSYSGMSAIYIVQCFFLLASDKKYGLGFIPQQTTLKVVQQNTAAFCELPGLFM